MKERLIALGVALSFLSPSSVDATPPRTIEAAPASTIEIETTTCMRGSDVRALDTAVRLCRDNAEGRASIECSSDALAIEHPRREVTVSAFRLDRTEVTQSAYARCVAAGACAAPRRASSDPEYVGDLLPVSGVRARDASRYCAWVGGRLPTETEWECSARGKESRFFPWGDEWDQRLANHGRAGRRVDGSDGFRGPAPVGRFSDGNSRAGLADLAGNVAEWVADPFVQDAYDRGASVDPIARGGSGLRIARGGSFLDMPHALRASSRRIEAEDFVSLDIGFRCAYEH